MRGPYGVCPAVGCVDVVRQVVIVMFGARDWVDERGSELAGWAVAFWGLWGATEELVHYLGIG